VTFALPEFYKLSRFDTPLSSIFSMWIVLQNSLAGTSDLLFPPIFRMTSLSLCVEDKALSRPLKNQDGALRIATSDLPEAPDELEVYLFS